MDFPVGTKFLNFSIEHRKNFECFIPFTNLFRKSLIEHFIVASAKESQVQFAFALDPTVAAVRSPAKPMSPVPRTVKIIFS